MVGHEAGKVCVRVCVCLDNLNKWTTDDKTFTFYLVHKYLFILNHS